MQYQEVSNTRNLKLIMVKLNHWSLEKRLIQIETETKIQKISADQIKLEKSKIEQINKRNEELIDPVDDNEKN